MIILIYGISKRCVSISCFWNLWNSAFRCVFPQERLANWKTYRHSSLYAWHHSNSRCLLSWVFDVFWGVESVERIEKTQVGSEKFRLVKVNEIYQQKDGFCRVRGSFGVPFKQQDTHYKPPSFFTCLLEKPSPTSKSLTTRAVVPPGMRRRWSAVCGSCSWGRSTLIPMRV